MQCPPPSGGRRRRAGLDAGLEVCAAGGEAGLRGLASVVATDEGDGLRLIDAAVEIRGIRREGRVALRDGALLGRLACRDGGVQLALLRILDGPGARGAVVYAGTEALDAQL